MEFFLLLLMLGGGAAMIGRNRALAERLDRLEREVEALSSRDAPAGRREPVAAFPLAEAPAAAAAPEPDPEAFPGAWAGSARETAPEAAPPPPEPMAEPAAEGDGLGGLFERFVAGKLLIWTGGLALIVAGVFLVRHSIEIGLVTPELRMVAAALFGLALLAAGEYARGGRLFADDPRFAQALVGAGIAVLYAAAYGAYILYGLLGPGAASACMVAVTGAALVLSLRHGAPTAVMGLVGGFLTPALVGDPDAGAVPLLAYLALLNGAVFAIAWRRGWTWLAAAAVAGSFVWTALLVTAPAESDALAAGAFVAVLAVAASLLRPGEGRHLRLLQPAAIGVVQLAILVARTDTGAAGWTLYGALAAASIALAALRPGFRLAPPLALALAVALIAAKGAVFVADPALAWAALGVTLLYGGFGLWAAARRPSLPFTVMAAAAFAGPAAALRAPSPDLLGRPAWGLVFLLLAAGPALLARLRRSDARTEGPADLGLLAAAAALALLLGLAVWDLLPRAGIAPGWAAVALILALAARVLRDSGFALVAIVAATVAAVRSLAMVPELSAAWISAFIGEPVLASDLPGAAGALWALAMPALLFAAARIALPGAMQGARRALPATAGLFGLAALYVWYKQAWGLGSADEFLVSGFAERLVLTQALFALGWLLASGRVRIRGAEANLIALAGILLTAAAAARLVWFDMLVHNPAWDPQWVGRWPVLNLLLPAFFGGAVWLYLARRRAVKGGGFWLACFLAALLVGTALLVRQGFQGAILTGPELPRAEFYGYSLAGLILSAALLVAGVRLPDKALRLAGLLLLTATVLKVFLVDASELEGVLRILSFLGLGAFLIGIGRLYGPVLRAGAAPDSPG